VNPYPLRSVPLFATPGLLDHGATVPMAAGHATSTVWEVMAALTKAVISAMAANQMTQETVKVNNSIF